mmetsp:Transcript_37671/g.89497  ORF Transcript_37671/g.89497 Transcript_37671/m.89497 type:complete len:203 (+) Transcript_37671:588-1196(+)
MFSSKCSSALSKPAQRSLLVSKLQVRHLTATTTERTQTSKRFGKVSSHSQADRFLSLSISCSVLRSKSDSSSSTRSVSAACRACSIHHEEGKQLVRPVCSASQLSQLLTNYANKLVVLMCKARSCRSCKYFTKKFYRVAEHHPDCVFLELTCDESEETFRLMEDLQVPYVPHFVVYKSGYEKIRLSCTNEQKLEETIAKAHA